MATRTTRKGTSVSEGKTSDEDVAFKLRLEEALDDPKIAAKFAGIVRSGNQELLASISSLHAEVQSLKATLKDRDAAIADLQAEVRKLRDDHDSLEQYGRRNNLRISGVPEPKLEPEEVEDTTATIVDLANSALKLDPPLQVSDVEVSHRLKKPRNAKDGDPRPIIVRFRSKQERFHVISNRRHMKDYNDENSTRIYINEDLTASRAKLFSTVRQLQKKKYFNQAWTYNGTIRVKDMQGMVKIISNTDDIKTCLPNVDLSAVLWVINISVIP